jgi:hypothetical protein
MARVILCDQNPDHERRNASDRLRALVMGAAWASIVTGLALGGVIGLWSFDGPMAAPPGFEYPSALPRRLVRLAHIAFLALPVFNILHLHFGRPAAPLNRDIVSRAGPPAVPGAGAPSERVCRTLIAGSWILPVTLAVAAWWPAAKYALPVPVTMILVPCVLAAVSWMRTLHEERGFAR